MRIRSPEWLWNISRTLHQRGFRRMGRLVKMINFFIHRALLPGEALVGENLVLEHYGLGVVIHPNVTIGDECRIYHHVTIAGESMIGGPERVTIGDRVTLGVNAVVLPRSDKSLSIGDDAMIGAGAVVTSDVPAGAIVAGVPARILRYRDDLEELTCVEAFAENASTMETAGEPA